MSVKNVVLSLLGMVIRLGITVAIIYFVYNLSHEAYNFGYNVFADIPADVFPGRDVEVTITDSMSEKDIAEYFEKTGLTKDWKLFYVQERFSEYRENVTPGVYALNTSMSSQEIMAVIGAFPEGDGETGDYEVDENAEPVSNATVVAETMDEDEMSDDYIDNGGSESEESEEDGGE